MTGHAARLLRIHISEADRYQGRPLYEAIVEKCRELKIAGATVFQGVEGYGETTEMHRTRLMRHDRPIVISIVDTADRVEALIPALEQMMDTGLIAVSEVQATRIQKGPAAPGGGGA